MPVFFLDTRALVKRYINETGSAWVLGLFDPVLNHEFYVAAIAEVELIAAVTRRSRSANISPSLTKTICTQIRHDFQTNYQVIEITESVISTATTLAENYGLRGYDAVQLSVAQAVKEIYLQNSLPSPSFVSADNELNRAAAQAGFPVENPNNFP